MSYYFRHLKLIANSLTVINFSISYKELAIQALGGFLFEYDHFVTIVTNNPKILALSGLRSHVLI